MSKTHQLGLCVPVLALGTMLVACATVTDNGGGRYHVFSHSDDATRRKATSICPDYQVENASSGGGEVQDVSYEATRVDYQVRSTGTGTETVKITTPYTTSYRGRAPTFHSLDIFCPNGRMTREKRASERKRTEELHQDLAAGRRAAAEQIRLCTTSSDEQTCIKAVDMIDVAIMDYTPDMMPVYERACASSQDVPLSTLYRTLMGECDRFAITLCVGSSSMPSNVELAKKLFSHSCELNPNATLCNPGMNEFLDLRQCLP
jgi:hypothetical protein